MTNLFIYGTLKRGCSNSHFLAGQNFLGEVRTAPGFTLYSVGDYPGMVRSPGDNTGVTGELWVVDDACLAELDRLEGLDEGLYERIDVLLAPNPFAGSAQSYFYLHPHQSLAPIGSEWPDGPVT